MKWGRYDEMESSITLDELQKSSHWWNNRLRAHLPYNFDACRNPKFYVRAGVDNIRVCARGDMLRILGGVFGSLWPYYPGSMQRCWGLNIVVIYKQFTRVYYYLLSCDIS